MRLLVTDVARIPASVVHALGVTPGAAQVELRISVEGVEYAAVVGLSWSRLPTRGLRPWWRCPGPGCGARRRWLYLPAQGPRCRRCPDLDLTYRCSRDHRTGHHERVLRPLLAAALSRSAGQSPPGRT